MIWWTFGLKGLCWWKHYNEISVPVVDIPVCWKSLWTEGERANDEHLLMPELLFCPGKQMDLLFNIQAMSILSSAAATLSSMLPTPTTITLYWLRPPTSNNQINYNFYFILFFLLQVQEYEYTEIVQVISLYRKLLVNFPLWLSLSAETWDCHFKGNII